MSAFVVGRPHIEAMVLLGLDGPAGHPVFPGSPTSSPFTWYASDPRAVAYESGNPGAYFAGLEAIRRTLTHETAEETARMLTFANVASVRHRYSNDADDDLPGSGDWSEPFNFNARRRQARTMPTAVEGLLLLACYEYQSCERPDWDGSEAQRFCDSLRSLLIRCLPGYDAAPWEWSWIGRDAVAR